MSAVINRALWIENGDGAAVAHPVCITGKAGREALITFIDARGGACPEPGRGGTRRVPKAEIAPDAPLSAAEERDYQRLDAELAATRGDSRKLRRVNALRLRSVRHPEIVQ